MYKPPWLGKIFKFTVFKFLENAMNVEMFTDALSFCKKFSPKFLLLPLRHKEITYSHRERFIENLFSLKAEKSG